MKQKVFINQDSGYLTIDIVNAHVEAGYRCVLFTGRLIERNNPLHPEVKIERIIPYKRSKSISRIFTWVWAFLQITFRISLKYRKSELFIISNPPLAPFLPLIVKNPFSLLIWDIYPDALVVGKILKESSFIVKWWENANKKVYTKAIRIFTLTETMGNVLQQYTSGKQPVIVPVWTDNTFLKPLAKKDNPFISQHALQGKFVVMYSGNLGYTHNVESIAEIAAAVKNPAIQFIIIGEGDGKDSLAAKIRQKGLTNCQMLPWQNPSELPYSLSAADLAIVSSGGGASNLSIPSKTYNLMSVGAPLLCLAQSGSELEHLINKHQNGQCFSHDRVEEIAAFIEQLVADTSYHAILSKNSLLAAGNYGKENVGRFLE